MAEFIFCKDSHPRVQSYIQFSFKVEIIGPISSYMKSSSSFVVQILVGVRGIVFVPANKVLIRWSWQKIYFINFCENNVGVYLIFVQNILKQIFTELLQQVHLFWISHSMFCLG
jgi:hypothetical protein